MMTTDLEGRIVLGDLHGELVRDGSAAVLQGDQAEVGQAGGVCRVPGCSQDHQAGSEGKPGAETDRRVNKKIHSINGCIIRN